MIFTISQKNAGQSVLKYETLYITHEKIGYSHLPKVKSPMLWSKDWHSFPSQALLCSKDELALLNMRWYLTHLFKVLHLCWFNKRNNKRILFFDDSGKMHQNGFVTQLIMNQWQHNPGLAEKNICFLNGNSQNSGKKSGTVLSIKAKGSDLPPIKQKTYKNMIGKVHYAFNQLFGLTEFQNKHYTSLQINTKQYNLLNKHELFVQQKVRECNHYDANFEQVRRLGTKQNIMILSQNSRLPLYGMKSNMLTYGGLFSNSPLGFKSNHLMLMALLSDNCIFGNRSTWSGTTWHAIIKHISLINGKSRLKVGTYEQIMARWYKKECTHVAKSPWKLDAELVFFTNPGKTPAMVEQICRLGIPTAGLVDGVNIAMGQRRYGLFSNNHGVDYAIIGLANSIYFVQSVVSKCLAVTKQKKIMFAKPTKVIKT